MEAAAALVLNSLLAQGCRWSQGRWQRRRRWWRRRPRRRLRSTCCSRRRLNSVATWITGAHQKLLLRSKNENSNLLYSVVHSTNVPSRLSERLPGWCRGLCCPRLCSKTTKDYVRTPSDAGPKFLDFSLSHFSLWKCRWKCGEVSDELLIISVFSYSSLVLYDCVLVDLTAIFFKLVQCQPQLNHQTQPFWVKGFWLVHAVSDYKERSYKERRWNFEKI